MRGETLTSVVASSRPGKRPIRALSASEKMDAIQRVHEGESKASVARDIGVPESTLRGWCKSEHKIRGMARNSSTPDSEAHSPASSGGNPLLQNLSSEDEGCGIGSAAVIANNLSMGSAAKKMKLDDLDCSLEQQQQQQLASNKLDSTSLNNKQQSSSSSQPKMDYVSSLINSLVAGGVRSEQSSLLLQQLGLLQSAQSAASLTKNLLGISSSTHLGALNSSPQTVGLVENGLQYSKNSNSNNNNKRNCITSSSSSAHISAIAPTQLDLTKSGSRRSLPPAAEAPLIPLPSSPRKSNDTTNGVLNLHKSSSSLTASSLSSLSKRDNGCNNNNNNNNVRKTDEALWLWLAQQQQLLGQQQAAAVAAAAAASSTTASQFNSTAANNAAAAAAAVDGSWFWQWYKQQCSFSAAAAAAQTSLTSMQQQQQQQQQQHQQQQQSSQNRKSPSKAKALLDNVLCNNNNDSIRRSLNSSFDVSSTADGLGNEDAAATGNETGEANSMLSTEEAIEHGEQFFKWLDKCSNPSVTQMQIMQFKFLLDNLKSCRKKTSSSKHSRK